MKFINYLSLSSFLIILSFTVNTSFKSTQKEHARVRDAYNEKEKEVTCLLNNINVKSTSLRLYIRAFKEEQLLELWAKNATDQKYQLLKEYDICRSSGIIGPKRMQGDLQVPEGFYHIDRFNPYSNYHLSLGINYPNKSDRILGNKNRLGGDIFIHGNCVTIGCMPMTDDLIQEIYILCIEAKNNGQVTIPVNIFPAKLTDNKLEELTKEHADEKGKTSLWHDLKIGFDYFEKNKTLPNISFLNNGSHLISE